MGKNSLWLQTTAAPDLTPANALSVNADAGVRALEDGLWIPWESARVTDSASGAEMVLTRFDSPDEFFVHNYNGVASFASRAELDAAFPDNSTCEFVGVPDDGSSGSIIFTAPAPGTIPHFTNLEAIQTINPSLPFRFEWNDWIGAAGANGYIPFDIIRPGQGSILTVGLPRTATGYEIPEFTLLPGESYIAMVNFSSGLVGVGTEWDGRPMGSPAGQWWNYRTQVTFTVAEHAIAYQIDKHSHWRQTSAAPEFTCENAAETYASASMTEWPTSAWESVRVLFPDSGYGVSLERYEYTDPVLGLRAGFVGQARFDSRVALDTAFPDNSVYLFEAVPDGSPSERVAFNVPAPGTIPRFSNYDAIQTINPCQPLRFEWDPWLGAAADGSYIHFNIHSDNWDHQPVREVLPRSATGLEVAGSVLIPGRIYTAVLGFTSGRYGNEMAWDLPTRGWQVWEYRTEVTFTVRVSDLSPVAGVDALGVRRGTAVTVAAARLLLNDFDPDCDPLSIVSVTSGAHGTVSFIGGLVTYTPELGYSGADSFTYQVSDGAHESTGTVSVTVGEDGVGENMLGVAVSGGDVLVRFGGISGLTYAVQHATAVPGSWSDLPGPVTIPVNNNVAEYLHVNGAALMGFYRTRRL